MQNDTLAALVETRRATANTTSPRRGSSAWVSSQQILKAVSTWQQFPGFLGSGARAHYNVGVLAAQLGEQNEAVAAFESAGSTAKAWLELEVARGRTAGLPEHVQALTNLGRFELATGRGVEALALADPDHGPAHHTR